MFAHTGDTMKLVTLGSAAQLTGRTVEALRGLVEAGELSWRVCTVRTAGPVRYYLLTEVRAAVMRADLKQLEAM